MSQYETNNVCCLLQEFLLLGHDHLVHWKPTSRALLANCFHAGFLLGLCFDPEDGGDIFLQNIGWLSMDYMALCPRRQNSSKPLLWEPQILQTVCFRFTDKQIRYCDVLGCYTPLKLWVLARMIRFINTVTHSLLITLTYKQYSATAQLHHLLTTVAHALGLLCLH
jgi:hypothetical protein